MKPMARNIASYLYVGLFKQLKRFNAAMFHDAYLEAPHYMGKISFQT